MNNKYDWLNQFDVDDLKDFVKEILSTVESFDGSPKDRENLDALIYEWRETSAIIKSGVLSRVMVAQIRNVLN